MLVLLKRPVFTKVGFFQPDPSGVTMPDSLFEFISGLAGAEVIEAPDETRAVPDPDTKPSAGSFVAHFDGDKPQAKKSTKAQPKINLDD